MSLYKILIGDDTTDPDFSFEDDQILSSPTGELSVDAIGDEMAIDIINASVIYDNNVAGVTDITSIKYGTPVLFYKNDVLFSKMYFKKISRSGIKTWNLETMSYVGILDRQYSYGGLYKDKKFKYIVNDILTVFTPKFQMLDGFYGGSSYYALNGDLKYFNTSLGYRNYEEEWITSRIRFNTSDGILSRSTLMFDLYFEIDYTVPDDLVWTNSKILSIYSPSVNYAISYELFTYKETENSITKKKFGIKMYNGSELVSTNYISNNDDDTNLDKWYFHIIFNYQTSSIYIYATGDIDDGYTFYRSVSIPASITFEGTGSIFSDVYDTTRMLKINTIDTYYLNGSSWTSETWYPIEILFNNDIKYAYYNPRRNTYTYAGQMLSDGTTIISTKYLLPGNPIDYNNQYFVGYDIPDPEGFTIVYKGDCDKIVLSGWLPIDTKRNNLHKAMAAAGVILDKDSSGNWTFRHMPSSSDGSISTDVIYNEGSVEYYPSVSEIEVTEHDFVYISESEESTLFDNSESYSVNSYLVAFSNPVEITSIYSDDGLTIEDLHCNYAVVSGRGVLKGIELVHSERVISKSVDESYAEENTNQVSDQTLANKKNSQNILWRLYDYYVLSRKTQGSFVWGAEKTGRKYSFKNKFNEDTSGYITKMSLTGSKNTKANCEFLTNFAPSNYGNNYSNYILLNGSGTWTVPNLVLQDARSTIHVIIIGGGTGGDSGYAGESGGSGVTGDNGNGSAPTMWYTLSDGEIATPGEGGSGGYGGKGGKIYEITIDNSDMEESYEYSCGTGGAGGETCSDNENNNVGTAGTATTFGEYSSDNGASATYGVTNIFTGEVYGVTGENGVSGFRSPVLETYYDVYRGDSSNGTKMITYFYPNYHHGVNTIYYKGREKWKSGNGYYSPDVSSTNLLLSPSGGGPAIGSNGSDAQQPVFGTTSGTGGNGGNARNRLASVIFGNGGNGGHGGGGGGVGGGEITVDGVSPFGGVSVGGTGGTGGAGGAGAPGCILIYY